MENANGRAMILTGIGVPWEMKEYPIPDVEPNAILVKITMASICGSDVHTYKGERRGRVIASKENPMIGGHEMTGRIYKMGRNVKSDSLGQPLKEGDRIVYSYFILCGKCPSCHTGAARCPDALSYRGNSSDEYPHFVGAFSEYYYLRPEQWVYKVPDVLPDESVTSVNCAISAAAYGMHKVSIPLGGQVVVQGAGGLGLSVAVMAKEMGAAQVIVVDRLPNRLERSKSFGADAVINMSEYSTPEARIEKVRRLTNGRGVDVVVEANGHPEVVAEGIEMLGVGGTYLTMGLVSGKLYSQIDMARITHKGLTIMGSGSYKSWTIPKVLDLMVRTKDKYPFDRLISHKFRLEDINEAFNQVMAGKVIRAGLIPG
jgi:L-iditol 2-dehydrogenase